MRLDRFDLNLLVVFEAVYSLGNLTRAAENLNMAQPTVSNALARLRKVFDDPLFVRSGRGVVPTPMARKMIAPIRQSLRFAQATLDDSLGFDPATSDRTFAISIGEVAAASIIPKLIETISRQAPRVKLKAFQTDRRAINDELAQGNLDLAIDIPRLSARELNHHALQGGDYVVVLRQGHPKARGRMTVARFLTFDFIAVSSRPTGSSLLDLAFAKAGRRAAPVLRTQHYLPAFRILQASDYALVAPRSVAKQFGMTIRELPFELGPEGMWMYWHPGADQDPANQWLRDLVIRADPDYSGRNS